jgi:hypothetical protein
LSTRRRSAAASPGAEVASHTVQVTPIVQQVGNAAHPGPDDRDTRHECFVDHERRVFEPEGRHHRDVELRVDLAGPLAIERAHEVDEQARRPRAGSAV